MILLDANILLYAHFEELPQSSSVRKWLERTLSGGKESIAIPWIAITAFLRIGTSRRIFGAPLSIRSAAANVDALLSHPKVEAVGPKADHWAVFSRIVRSLNLSGDTIMDAHIAAIAIEHNATVASCDKDFRRFTDHIKIIDPSKA